MAPLLASSSVAGFMGAFSTSSLDSLLVDLNETVSPDSVHPHVIEKLVPNGEVTLLAGHGGSGKSFLALLLCVLVALGMLFGTLQTTRTKVLFFSAEDDKAEMLRRLSRICKNLGIDQESLNGWLFLIDVSETEPTLKRFDNRGESESLLLPGYLSAFVAAHDIGLTVIDNASDTFDGNEIVRAQVRAFIRGLRTQLARPDRAVILLAHVSKVSAHNSRTGMKTDEDYSGSTAWHNSVRSRLSLDTDGDGIITLKHLKANKGVRSEPIRLEWLNGAPNLVGSDEYSGSSIAAALRKATEKKQDEADKASIIEIIKEFDARGERVPTSSQGAYTTYGKLNGEPGFPLRATKKQFPLLMRDLEREGRVFRETKQTPNRKYVECFTCLKKIVDIAPNEYANQSNGEDLAPGVDV